MLSFRIKFKKGHNSNPPFLVTISSTSLTLFNKILDDLEIIEVHLEDAGALVVCCLEDEEGDVSHLENDA